MIFVHNASAWTRLCIYVWRGCMRLSVTVTSFYLMLQQQDQTRLRRRVLLAAHTNKQSTDEPGKDLKCRDYNCDRALSRSGVESTELLPPGCQGCCPCDLSQMKRVWKTSENQNIRIEMCFMKRANSQTKLEFGWRSFTKVVKFRSRQNWSLRY